MTPLAIALFLIILGLFIWAHRSNPSPKLPPGPKPLPIIGNLHILGQLPHRALEKLAQKYGPIMSLRLGHVPTIVVSTPQTAQLILKTHDAVFASRPITRVSDHLTYGMKGVALTPSGDYWRRVRKTTTLTLLTPAKVEGFEGLRRAEIEGAVRWLKAAGVAREVVDVGERVGELIEDITFKMVVGNWNKKFDLRGVVHEGVALAGAFNVADYIPWLGPLDLQGLTCRMKAVSNMVDDILESIIEDHLKVDDFGDHKDIISAMLALMDKPNGEVSFDRDNVKALMLDLFVGAIESSSLTITWAIAALLKHPRVMTLLQEELDTIIGRGRMVKESDLSKLSYLDMVVKETMRLYPAAPFLIPRESMEDIVINGYIIPKKTRVIVNFWAISRDPNTWSKNAEEFHPERFMNRDIDVRGHDFELIPFGAGRRGCPGIQLGLITVKLALAQLVHCFDWELPSGMQPKDVDMTEKFGLSLPRATKLFARPSYRLQVSV